MGSPGECGDKHRKEDKRGDEPAPRGPGGSSHSLPFPLAPGQNRTPARQKILVDIERFFKHVRSNPAAYTSWTMRRLLAAAGLAGAIATPAAAAPPIVGTGDSAVALVSPTTPAARPAALKLLLRYEMLCAQPGRGPVLMTLPAAVRVPAKIRATAVLVNGKAAPSLSVRGHILTVGLPLNSNVICRSFVPGILWIDFTTSARLGNPVRAGTYAIHARVGSHTFVARLAIHR